MLFIENGNPPGVICFVKDIMSVLFIKIGHYYECKHSVINNKNF